MVYIPLHVHSIVSPYHGMLTPAEIVSRAVFMKLPSIALTDRWTSYSHHEFCRLAEKAGIKPILGAEIQHLSLTGSRGAFHLTLLAENDAGYRNLLALITKHYEKEKNPYVNEHEMVLHRDGLIAMTGCLRGEVSQSILHGNLARERAVVEKLITIYGRGNVYLEIMNHNDEREQFVIDQVIPLSKKLKVPMVVTNNDRFLQKEHGSYYSLLRRLEGDPDPVESDEIQSEHYLKRQRDLEPFFYVAGSALEESGRIAERCNVRLDKSKNISFSDVPDPHGLLEEMCDRRFLLGFHNKKPSEAKELKKLYREELSSASREEMSSFVIFLSKLFHGCNSRGIRLEMMGGDILESFIAYLLEIVPLNPVDHGLVFESFHSFRPGVPHQLEILKSKGTREILLLLLRALLPGEKIVNQVVREEMSMTTIVRDLASALELGEEKASEMLAILSLSRKKSSLQELLDNSDTLTHLYNEDELVRKILHAAHYLRGRVLHFNLNTSRFVVLPKGMHRQSAFVAGPNGESFVLLDNRGIEESGGWLLLVQRSHFLSALEETYRSVESRTGSEESADAPPEKERGIWREVPLSDDRTFELISSGNTTGVYLLESKGIRDLLVRTAPSSFDELVNVISMYRPGPLEGKLWQKYLENAEKKGKVFLPHHSLAGPLEKTRGLLLYKEQLREILRYSAGMTGERALRIEHALQKRDSGELLGARLDFIRGAMDRDIDEEDAQKIFDFLLHNMEFTYDKAFSCAQAYISYRTAFMKANYHDEYFASLLNSTSDIRERQIKYLDYLESIKRAALPPDLNSSGLSYIPVTGGIRSPLNESGTLEQSALEKIIADREEKGGYDSLDDFMKRMSASVSMDFVNDMIDAGLFDFSMVNRSELKEESLDFYEKHARAGDFFRSSGGGQKNRGDDEGTQLSFFDDL